MVFRILCILVPKVAPALEGFSRQGLPSSTGTIFHPALWGRVFHPWLAYYTLMGVFRVLYPFRAGYGALTWCGGFSRSGGGGSDSCVLANRCFCSLRCLGRISHSLGGALCHRFCDITLGDNCREFGKGSYNKGHMISPFLFQKGMNIMKRQGHFMNGRVYIIKVT